MSKAQHAIGCSNLYSYWDALDVVPKVIPKCYCHNLLEIVRLADG